MTIKRVDDFRQVFARERLAASENQDTEIAAQRLRYTIDLMRFHLEFLAWSIIEFIREETMRAAHVAHRSYQDIQQNRRERLAQGHLRVTLK